MKTQTTGLHAFVPSGPDFQQALDFHAELGFSVEWENGDCAGLRCGGAYFILQNIDARQWAEMQMLALEVEDLEAWWQEFSAKNTEAKFQGTRTRPPKDFPWGREIHLTDPAGVCWHVRQRP
jgi:hypothetical protein